MVTHGMARKSFEIMKQRSVKLQKKNKEKKTKKGNQTSRLS